MSTANSKKRANDVIASLSERRAEKEKEAAAGGDSGGGEVDSPAGVEREDGAELLLEIERNVREYVYLTNDHYYAAVVLWTATTHVIDHMEHATRLAIISPEPQCGKTRVLDLLECLTSKPFPTVNASVAAITRSISQHQPPTLIIDEADTIFGTKRVADSNEDLRGILNAGHARGKFVTRWDPTARELEQLRTFAPAALAAIKSLPDTIMSRSIEIPMRRRPNDVPIKPFRIKRDGRGVFSPLGKRLAAWAKSVEFGAEDVELPVEDRAADNWESLVAVAEAAGGVWPQRARAAAVALTGLSGGPDTSFAHEALADLRRVWEPGAAAMHSETIVDRMKDLEEAPWLTYGGGIGDGGPRGLTQNRLARLLHPYGIRTKQVRVGETNRQGYQLDHWLKKGEDVPAGGLQAAWNSYLDPAENDEGPAYINHVAKRAEQAAKAFAAEGDPEEETDEPTLQMLMSELM